MSDPEKSSLKKKRPSISIPKSILSGSAPTFSLKRALSEDEENTKKDSNLHLKKKKKKTKKGKKKSIKVKCKAHQELLDYLYLWKHDRESWKFNKTVQKLLIKLIYDKEKLPEGQFEVLLEYLENSQGQIRSRVYQEAVEKCEKTESKENQHDAWVIQRAKKLLAAFD